LRLYYATGASFALLMHYRYPTNVFASSTQNAVKVIVIN
jgi:hypothetical protein